MKNSTKFISLLWSTILLINVAPITVAAEELENEPIDPIEQVEDEAIINEETELKEEDAENEEEPMEDPVTESVGFAMVRALDEDQDLGDTNDTPFNEDLVDEDLSDQQEPEGENLEESENTNGTDEDIEETGDLVDEGTEDDSDAETDDLIDEGTEDNSGDETDDLIDEDTEDDSDEETDDSTEVPEEPVESVEPEEEEIEEPDEGVVMAVNPIFPEARIISGYANPNANVIVIYPGTSRQRSATVGSDGYWMVRNLGGDASSLTEGATVPMILKYNGHDHYYDDQFYVQAETATPDNYAAEVDESANSTELSSNPIEAEVTSEYLSETAVNTESLEMLPQTGAGDSVELLGLASLVSGLGLMTIGKKKETQ